MTFRAEQVIAEKTVFWQTEQSAREHHADAGTRPKTGYLPITNTIMQEIRSCSRVLDVGCGHGRLSLMLAECGHDVVASDVSAQMLELLNTLKGDLDITTVREDARNLSHPAESFDAVVSIDFMVHFPDWESILQEKARVCRPGGVLAFPFLFREHRELAERLGVSAEEHPYSNGSDPNKPFVAETSEPHLRAFADSLGLDLVRIVPASFFDWNLIMFGANGRESQNQFIEELNRRIDSDAAVGEFYVWLMEQALARLPLATTWYSVVVLHKRSAAPTTQQVHPAQSTDSQTIGRRIVNIASRLLRKISFAMAG